MRTITKLATVGTTVAALGGLGLAGTASATEPPRHDTKPVVRHDNHRHHDLLALCRREHGHHHPFLVRVDSRRQLHVLEHRFDLKCRVLRVL